jgi:tRNA-dihydrouridine synthase
MSRADGIAKAKASGVDGIMIGRGIFHDPFVFAEEAHQQDLQTMLALLKKHTLLHQKTWKGNKFEPLKKFVKMYINGFDGSAKLRAEMMATKTHPELLLVIDKYLK